VHALLVCDDEEETALLRLLLQRVGLTVQVASSLERAMQAHTERGVDAVVLALRVGSPRAQVLRVRRDSEAGVVLISSTDDEDEICGAYESGADVVVVRPYSARLLGMQLRALLRRSQRASLGTMPPLRAGDMVLDPSMRVVTVGARPPRRLTQLEFRLLRTLMIHQGRTVPTQTIVESVWGLDGAGGMELVRGLVRRLRGKVEQDPRRPRYIITEPGLGYRLDVLQEDGT